MTLSSSKEDKVDVISVDLHDKIYTVKNSQTTRL